MTAEDRQGWADAAVEWSEKDGLHVARHASDGVAALVYDAPRGLRVARALLAAQRL